jgi:hypothetical protein
MPLQQRWMTFFWIAVAAIALAGAVIWIALLLWAAREDGRDEDAHRRAQRQRDEHDG